MSKMKLSGDDRRYILLPIALKYATQPQRQNLQTLARIIGVITVYNILLSQYK